MNYSTSQKRVALFNTVQTFQAFGGAPLRTLDAADELSNEQVQQLIDIQLTLDKGMRNLHALVIAEETSKPDVRPQDRAYMEQVRSAMGRIHGRVQRLLSDLGL